MKPVLLIALGSLILTACVDAQATAAQPRTTTSTPHAPNPTRPSGMTIITVSATQVSPVATFTPLQSAFSSMILNGRVYDAGRGLQQRLSDATIEWQFTAPDWQVYNGQLRVPADGLYRLQLPVRAEDTLIITARAPGFLPSTARLRGDQLNVYGSRLNFGLVSTNGPVPTLPGDLGAIQLRGIVFNSARGAQAPIPNANVTIVDNSVVQPKISMDVAADASGTFSTTLDLHTTDEIEFIVAATDYVTGTLTRRAKDLLNSPQITIGLRPR